MTTALFSNEREEAGVSKLPNKKEGETMARRPESVGGITRSICVSRVARTFASSLLAIALLGAGHLAEARITRIVIETRTSPAFGGASFGNVGQYEQLTGVAYGEVIPKDPLTAVITDIELAPRNARGRAE